MSHGILTCSNCLKTIHYGGSPKPGSVPPFYKVPGGVLCRHCAEQVAATMERMSRRQEERGQRKVMLVIVAVAAAVVLALAAVFVFA